MSTPDLQCSPGAQMLIDAMRATPQDFACGGKLDWIGSALQEGRAPRLFSERDAAALCAVYRDVVLEGRLHEVVVALLLGDDPIPISKLLRPVIIVPCHTTMGNADSTFQVSATAVTAAANANAAAAAIPASYRAGSKLF